MLAEYSVNFRFPSDLTRQRTLFAQVSLNSLNDAKEQDAALETTLDIPESNLARLG